MYGLVNLAIEELVNKVAGPDVWEKIKADVGFNDAGFIMMESYPDELTFQLVGSAAKHLGMTPEQVLKAFGKHWIKFTASKGYGELMETSASNLVDFLANLDNMHAQLEATVSGLNLPSFELEPEAGNQMLLRYYSDRDGLAPMVLGLVEGLSELFEEPCTIEYLPEESKPLDHELFRLELKAE